MRKTILLFSILIALAGILGFKLGASHVIYDAELFCVEIPVRNEYGGFDETELTVFMEIDGDIHEYGCIIG